MSDIFRRKICTRCGKVDYEEYTGKREFDGGFTTVNQFMDCGYQSFSLYNDAGEKHIYTLCPNCVKQVIMFIEPAKK